MSDISTKDVEDFMAQLRADVETARVSASRRNRGEVPMDDDDEKKPTGDVVQWANVGDGFMPTTDTVEALPPAHYAIDFMNSNPYFKTLTVRTDEIVSMPDSRSAYVIDEIKRFWGRQDKYKLFGLLYKLGVLMYGPPGSGKSITVKIVAQEMIKMGGIVLFADKHPSAVSNLLASLRKIEPNRLIVVVLEDVDSLIDNHGESEYLSLLDGENQIDNVVYIATTNYPERIDPRFVNRPSRFDLIVKIPMPNTESRKLYLEKLVQKTTVMSKSGKLIDLVAETEGLSLAHLREAVRSIFIADHDPEDTMARLKSMRVLPKSTGDRKIGIDSES